MKKLEDIILEKGDIVEFDDGEMLAIVRFDGCSARIVVEVFNKIVKSIKRPVKYETIYEAPHEILDKEEKDWLESFMKPFKNKAEYIEKVTLCKDREYIRISLNYDGASLPLFKKGTMYKGMKADKKYTLEELGLFDGEKNKK